MLNKIIEEVKKTEHIADNIIEDSKNKAEKIIKLAQKEVEKIIEDAKEEAKEEGKAIFEGEEKFARTAAVNIKKNCAREKEEIRVKSLGNIERAVNIVIKKVMEGK